MPSARRCSRMCRWPSGARWPRMEGWNSRPRPMPQSSRLVFPPDHMSPPPKPGWGRLASLRQRTSSCVSSPPVHCPISKIFPRIPVSRDVHQETCSLPARLPSFLEIDPVCQVFRFQHLQRLVVQIPPVPIVLNLKVDTISFGCRLHGLIDNGNRRSPLDHFEQPGDILLVQSDASVTDARPDSPGTIRAMNQHGRLREAERVAPHRILRAGRDDGREIGAFLPDRLRDMPCGVTDFFDDGKRPDRGLFPLVAYPDREGHHDWRTLAIIEEQAHFSDVDDDPFPDRRVRKNPFGWEDDPVPRIGDKRIDTGIRRGNRTEAEVVLPGDLRERFVGLDQVIPLPADDYSFPLILRQERGSRYWIGNQERQRGQEHRTPQHGQVDSGYVIS